MTSAGTAPLRPAEVDRPYRIRALKELGLGLAEISAVLEGTEETRLQDIRAARGDRHADLGRGLVRLGGPLVPEVPKVHLFAPDPSGSSMP